MNLKFQSSVIFVKDINIAKDFYSNTLNQTIEMDFGTNVGYKSGFTIWQIDPDHTIAKELNVNNIQNSPSHRFELYFETNNISDTYEILKQKNVTFLHELHEEPWGQQTIRFFDPDNHLIEIGETMQQFIKRFHNQGLTAIEISKRTSVPVVEVYRLLDLK
jgi:catechol 2,3-dioxygenase-like lactoylglutathione lyase family enzyme